MWFFSALFAKIAVRRRRRPGRHRRRHRARRLHRGRCRRRPPRPVQHTFTTVVAHASRRVSGSDATDDDRHRRDGRPTTPATRPRRPDVDQRRRADVDRDDRRPATLVRRRLERRRHARQRAVPPSTPKNLRSAGQQPGPTSATPRARPDRHRGRLRRLRRRRGHRRRRRRSTESEAPRPSESADDAGEHARTAARRRRTATATATVTGRGGTTDPPGGAAGQLTAAPPAISSTTSSTVSIITAGNAARRKRRRAGERRRAATAGHGHGRAPPSPRPSAARAARAPGRARRPPSSSGAEHAPRRRAPSRCGRPADPGREVVLQVGRDVGQVRRPAERRPGGHQPPGRGRRPGRRGDHAGGQRAEAGDVGQSRGRGALQPRVVGPAAGRRGPAAGRPGRAPSSEREHDGHRGGGQRRRRAAVEGRTAPWTTGLSARATARSRSASSQSLLQPMDA